MVQRNYTGLGSPDAALRAFDGLAADAATLLALQAECPPLGPDYKAFSIALDGLETAAYHFTRRRHYYDPQRSAARAVRREPTGRLRDPAQAAAALETLRPYVARLKAMQGLCRPFGRDYLALDIAKQALDTAAYHFTRITGFYGAQGDASGRGGR